VVRPKKEKSTEKGRRGRGKGSILWRDDRQKFQVSRSIDGKRKYEYVNTKKDAEALLKKWDKEVEQGLKFDRRVFTVVEYIDYWLEVKRPTIEPSTYLMYRNKTKPFCTELGKIKLDDLTTDKVQKAVNVLSKTGKYAPSTLRAMRGAFFVALQDAVSWELLLRNPVASVKLPPGYSDREEVEIIPPEQVARLLNVAYERGQKKVWALQSWALISLAIGSGLRHGELAGLLWSDVDFVKKEVIVRRQASYYTLDGETKFRDGKPKTRSSTRKIVLPDFAVSALVVHRKAQIERRLKAGSEWEDLDLVFTNARGHNLTPAGILRPYRKLLVEAEIPETTRLHTLRHTAASIMLKLKIPVTTVSSILGHSNPAITWAVYAHTVPGDQEESMITYNEFLSRYGVGNDVNHSV
jgi:integrase